jgi:hypothetical protein
MRPKSKQGNITVLFCVLALMLVGAVSYSIYVGQLVSDRIAEQNAADTSALVMANHAAQGLNMISANNLSIGAAVQVASSVANLSVYLGVIRTLFWRKSDFAYLARGTTPAQQEIMDNLRHISFPFLQSAAGMTKHNRLLYDHWMYVAPVRGMEVARANVPGVLTIPVQRSMVVDSGDLNDGVPFRLQGMRISSPGATVCQTFDAIEDHHNGTYTALLQWLSGPIMSLHRDANYAIAGVFGALGELEGLLTSGIPGVKIQPPVISMAAENGFCGLKFDMGLKIGFEIKGRLWRRIFGDYFPPGGFEPSLSANVLNIAEQAEAFARANDKETQLSFGFLIPAPGEGERPFNDFESSIEIANVLMAPIKSSQQINAGNCPASWQTDGKCAVSGVGVMTPNVGNTPQTMTSNQKRDLNTASGGLSQALANGGGMDSSLKRMKFRLGQAKAVFRPNDQDPASVRANEEQQNVGMQTFWPAWQATTTRATLLSDVMGKLSQNIGMAPGFWQNFSQ